MELLIILYEVKLYWEKNNISSFPQAIAHINSFEKKYGISLPKDFRDYFELMNGMGVPSIMSGDPEGFLFYPLEHLISFKDLFGIEDKGAIIIFADYMSESWWYGVKIDEDGYEIGIIPDKGRFKVLTTSLEQFFKWYLDDNAVLYDVE